MLAFLMADPFAGTLALLALLWAAAKLGGTLGRMAGLPAVAGELCAGLLIGALPKVVPGFPVVGADPALNTLANLGVVLLMFHVGLESTVPQMMQVGLPSVRVAVTGVVLPVASGLLGSWLLMPAGSPWLLHLFVGACLCATSIGISAQVLAERGAAQIPEGRVIVGAAVVDDVLGLLVLTAVTGIAGAGAAGAMPWGRLGLDLALALAFLAGALTLGRSLTPHLFRMASRLRAEELLLPSALAFAFLLAWLGNLAGLAAIVGAYAAGLILEHAHVQVLEARETHSLEELLRPLVSVLAPVFFVLMGAKVDAAALFTPSTLLLAGGLAVLGVASKLAAGWAAGKGFRSAVIGWGMVPRGEVGLIFIATGGGLAVQGEPLLGPAVQAGLVGAILLTTLAGPMGLGLALARPGAKP